MEGGCHRINHIPFLVLRLQFQLHGGGAVGARSLFYGIVVAERSFFGRSSGDQDHRISIIAASGLISPHD